MSSEQNKVITRRIPLEIYNQGHMGVADEVVSPDYIEHAPLPTGIQGLQLQQLGIIQTSGQAG